MKKFSNAIITGVLAIICFVCCFFIQGALNEGLKNAGFILLGATVAFLSDAIHNKKDN